MRVVMMNAKELNEAKTKLGRRIDFITRKHEEKLAAFITSLQNDFGKVVNKYAAASMEAKLPDLDKALDNIDQILNEALDKITNEKNEFK
jgi:hypothetical protein